jgi:hypothetical protein
MLIMYKIDLQELLGPIQNTMLYRYCDKEINNFAEPVRSGLKKGDKIGFSFAKNAAAILTALTNLQMKIIARDTGISYASLRTWNIQHDFIMEKERRLDEFAKLVRKEFDSGQAFEFSSDFRLYSYELKKRVNVARVNVVCPMPTVRATGSIFSRELLISEINRSKHMLDKGVMSREEKDTLRDLLTDIETYLNRKKT